MKKTWTGVGGLGVGAALMYLFDPERGNRRRALLRDKVIHVAHSAGEKVDVKSRDAANRLHGLMARTKSVLTRERVPDTVVAERVRSRIGHVASHPGSIDVVVRDGRVTLSGPALAGELDPLLSDVAHVRGVTGVENKLELHGEPGSVPGLQG
jgi:osmotically-inducible protein OsmY